VAHSSSDTAFLTLEKSFTFRGVREIWGNAYHLDIVPRDASDWSTLSGQVWALEAAFLPADVQIETFYGHNPGTPPVLVYEHDQPPPGPGGSGGTYVPGGAQPGCPGDCAMWVRWSTTQKNSLGKPIYLRNYYHGVHSDNTGLDVVASGQKTALQALGTAFTNGITVNGITFRRAGPRGAVAQGSTVGNYITTRTLKHRGKRRAWKVPAGATVQFPPLVIDGPIAIN
jgi:hypothetical protein